MNPHPRFGIAARIALATGTLTLVLLVSSALLMRAALHANQMAATEQLASSQAAQILSLTQSKVQLAGQFGTLPYELVRSDGRIVSSSPELTAAGNGRAVIPLAPENEHLVPGDVWTVRVAAGPLAGRTLTAVMSTLDGSYIVDSAGGSIPGGPVADPGSVAYHVSVIATTTAADQAVATIDPYLWGGVGIAVALVAGTAAITARRSLRPVDRMRRAAETISGAPDGARVSVPGGRNELHALAATLNAMLARIDEAALKQKRFTADAAHELRSPVSSLIAAVEIAHAHPGTVSTEETLRHVHLEARRLEGLANDLLELTSVGTATTRGPGVRSNVGEIIQEAIAATRSRSPRSDIRISEPDSTGLVLADLAPRELHRVLINLLDNAVRHARTTITVRLELDSDAANPVVRIEIANDGAAIPGDQLTPIFEPFVRLDESRSREAGGGAGLGLAIASETIRRSGGSITVTSTPAWTTFTVTLHPGAPDHPVGGSGG